MKVDYKCDICGNVVERENGDAPDAVANARLIAAAPEMLEDLIYVYETIGEGSLDSKDAKMIRRTIEKATGMKIEEVLE